MNKRFYTYIIFAIIIASFLLLIHDNGEESNLSKYDQKHYPSDMFFYQRTYPDNNFAIESYKSTLKEVSQKRHSKTITPVTDLTWYDEGPGNIGGRINEVIVHPTDSNIIYVGNCGGGIFKTIDGGINWEPIFDDHSYLSIGELIFDPNNPDIIYAGTGDPNISGYPFVGDGVYRSIDAGLTWTHLGLSETGIVSRISINPLDSNIIYVATMGIPFERDLNRGLYKSIDGGTSWTQALQVSDDAGIIDLILNPVNPQTIYAASWNRIRSNSESMVYGPDAKIHKSTDGGNTWTVLSGGLPTGYNSRIGITMSTSDTSLLYAMYVNTSFQVGGLYKTTDAGTNWTSLSVPPNIGYALGGFGWYFGQIRISPYNNNELYILGVDLYKTTDGGLIWNAVGPNWATYLFHADKHDLTFIDSLTMVCSTDGGLYKSYDGGNNWVDIENIQNTQFYKIAYDPHHPGWYAGGAQDNGTTYGNSSDINNWTRINGGDGFQPLFNYNDSNIIYSEMQNGSLWYSDGSNWQYFGNGIDPADRRSWDMPFSMSQTNPNRLYAGTYRVYKNSTSPYGNWTAISPDLTDSIASNFNVIISISESPLDTNIIYVGTSDANVVRSLDGGQSWTTLHDSLPNRFVSKVVASPNFVNSVFVGHSGYRDNDFIPHIHVSTDNGDTWTDISGNLPQLAVNDIVVPVGYADQIIFVATDGGIYFTNDGGLIWGRVGNNMPVLPVYDIEYENQTGKLIAGTFARSMKSVYVDSLFIPVGIEENNFITNRIEIYPNPASDFINFKSDFNPEAIEIFSVSGQLIYKNTIRNNDYSVDIRNLEKGTYLLNIISNKKIYSKRFVKI